MGVMTAHSAFRMRSYHATLIKLINQKSNELVLKDYRLVGHIEAIHHFTSEEVSIPSQRKVLPSTFYAASASNKSVKIPCQCLEGLISTWKDHNRNIGGPELSNRQCVHLTQP